ncbi:MAG TPA: aromatic ring-hydroxylating dioxygenase subunit alpha [Methylomirabilota bacterium]|nr:aromatic ring-hydroxylating dioxygenase subunit alpha [Methylomirabilota bacterium]
MPVSAEELWPRNAWYLAAWNNEIRDRPLGRTILNEEIVFFRNQEGRIVALEDRCCHRGAPLSLGVVTSMGLQCNYHGMTFDSSGKCVWIPSQDSIPSHMKVKHYRIAERQPFVWIWMGDPERADEGKLLSFPCEEEYRNGPHYYEMVPVKCDFRLLVDNLMDLTHITFLHRNTIGGVGETELTEVKTDMAYTDGGVKFIRWTLGQAAPPIYVKALRLGPNAKLDRWADFEYIAPTNIVQWTGAAESGRGAQQNRHQAEQFSFRILHSATPETENSCFYFWMRANPTNADVATLPRIHQQIAATVAEDVAMLEGQHSRLAAYVDRSLVDVKSDQIRVMARRALRRMIEKDAPEKVDS